MYAENSSVLGAYVREHNKYASYEFHEELVHRGIKSLEEGTIKHLYGEMALFKPDDFSIEKFSSATVRNILGKTGYDAFVSRIIEERFLREKLAGKFGYLTVEEQLRLLAMKAINEGNINVLLTDLSIPCFDEEPFTYEISKEEVAEKLEKIGLLDYVKYMVWLSSHK